MAIQNIFIYVFTRIQSIAENTE